MGIRRIGGPGSGIDPKGHFFIEGKDIPGLSHNHGSVKNGSLQLVVSFPLG